MNNFLIGMFNTFDEGKFKRDYRKCFFGIEACQLESKKELERLVKVMKNAELGIHYPLLQNDYPLRDPLLLSLDHDETEEAYGVLERELDLAADLKADYILVHFPKPVILKAGLDWSKWRFGHDREWVWESQYPYERFKEKCEAMFQRLARLSEKYGVRILLESDYVNEYIYKSDLLLKLLKRYPEIKMCMDTGRLHLQEKLDSAFDAMAFSKAMAPYTYLVHLWNVKVTNNAEGGHYPALPDLKVEEGWGDMGAYLRIFAAANPNVLVKFEHRSDLISDEALECCYRWVDSIFEEYRAEKIFR